MPAGAPVPGAVTATVAVSVTDWPLTDGLGAALTAVVVPAGWTVWVRTGDVLAVNEADPA